MRPAIYLLLLTASAGCSGDATSTLRANALTVRPSAIDSVGFVATTVPAAPRVTVTREDGSAASGIIVRWSVVSGGGRVGDSLTTTNTLGVAESGGWTLGAELGEQRIQATVSGSAPVTFSATARPRVAVRLVRASAVPGSPTVGSDAANWAALRAEDALGNPVTNTLISFTVVSGGGMTSDMKIATSASGVAMPSAWVLGTAAGIQTLRASALGVNDIDISVVAIAAAPATMTIVSGDQQRGESGGRLSQQLVVRVVDRFGNAIGGVPVTFVPAAGSGSIVGRAALTDSVTGLAVAGPWTLSDAATQTLTVLTTSGSAPSVTFTARVSATSAFDIEVRFIGSGGTERQRQAFSSAVARWRTVITSSIGSTPIRAPEGECASWIPALDERVKDLLIFVRVSTIDGPGTILGQATPCYVNASTKLPSVGFFELDVDDLALLLTQGILDNVVLHEMGHILGIGSLWSYQRTLLIGAGTDDPYFTGTAARSEFSQIGGNLYTGQAVPVENSGTAGTRDSHWRRSVFGTELMQGYAQPGGMPLSRTTIASLADLGYNVSFASAEPFNFLSSLRSVAGAQSSLKDDVFDGPLFEVDRSGVRRRVRVGTERR